MTALSPTAVARALGVSRVARLTGLDRSELEVATAVRPGGHVLQVTQGKGLTWAAAQWSALGEAAELRAAEAPPAGRLVWGRAEDFTATLGDAPDGLTIAWVRGRWLTGREVWVPADAVYCPPQGGVWLGPSVSEWTSNGLAAHRTRAAAVEHAVLELVERDAVARSLPEGWTPEVRRRRVRFTSPWTAKLERVGLEVFAFDLSPRGARVPTAGALVFDVRSSVVPLTAGYAARRTPGAAVEAAVLEAVQTRLTEIHGAREDVDPHQRVAGAELLAALQRSQAERPLAALPRFTGSLARLRQPIAVVELAQQPLVVVKALAPGLLRSELFS